MIFVFYSFYFIYIYIIFKYTFTRDNLMRRDKFGTFYVSDRFFFFNREGMCFTFFFLFNFIVYFFLVFHYFLYTFKLLSFGIVLHHIQVYLYVSTFVNIVYLYMCNFYLSIEQVSYLSVYWFFFFCNVLILLKYQYCVLCYFFFILLVEFVRVFFFQSMGLRNRSVDYFFFKKK